MRFGGHGISLRKHAPMRLTLRTLLAYLDDRLAPSQAKEIGQKVTTSPFATELADRIKSVVRRRRLAKESAGQKTIDANLIAEYLDDQLTPELVALIEKEILSSDATLAEVAATHQIIGMLNDPVELSEPMKERLYRLGPQPDRDDVQEMADTPSDWKPLEPQAVKQKRSPMLLLAAMVLGWLGLVATDSNIWQSATDPEVAKQGPQNPAADDPLLLAAGPGEPSPAEGQPESAIAKSDANENPSVQSDASKADMTGDSDAVVASNEPPVTVPSTENTQPLADPNSAAMNTEPATASSTGAESVAAAPKTPAADSSTDERLTKSMSLQLEDSYSMAVRYDNNNELWLWASDSGAVSNWKRLMTESVFGIAAPFDVQVIADEAGWITTLHGPTLFRSAASGSGIELIDGGLILQTIDSGIPGDLFTVRVADSEFQIALPEEKRQRIGVMVTPVAINQLDSFEAQESPTFIPEGQPGVVSVFAVDCDTTVILNGQEIAVGSGMQMQWQSNSETPPTPGPATIPEWMFEITNQKTEVVVDLLVNTAAEFRKSSTVADAASGLLESRNPLIAENAVQLPVVTRQLDDLCSILLETDQSKVRRGAIMGLQTIMRTSPQGRQKINDSLRTRLPEMDTESAMRLLAGISPVEAEDQYISNWLVGMLESNRVAIRELAIFNLERLTGTDESFQADDEPSRRGSAIRRWKKRLSRNDDRLLDPQG